MRLLLFSLDDARYGVRADAVVEIVRAVAVTPLPNAPAVVEGIIDVRGSVVPVFDLRRRFGRPTRPVHPDDQFILVRARSRVAALHADRAIDLVEVDDSAVSSLAGQVRATRELTGVATLDDGLALIHDVDAFLSAAEAESLDAALASSTNR